MIPGNFRGAGGDAIYAPLGGQFNRNFLPFEPNGETPVPNQWFDGGDVEYIPIRPNLDRSGVTDPKNPPKAPAFRIQDFFSGGRVLGGDN